MTIDKAAVDALVAHAREEAPLECCGLLIGTSDRVLHAHRARNADPSPRTRFLIDPRDHFDAIRRARDAGLDVVGVYHSHPSTPAQPSAADLAEVTYPEYAYAIVSLALDPPEVNIFRIHQSEFRITRY